MRCTAPAGRNFDRRLPPELTPAQMLRLGVFCGKYMTDCRKEFPKSWFARAKLAGKARDCALNYFGVDASQPLSVWRKKAGSIATIRAAGFNGIAAITWAGAFPTRTRGRSSAGKRSAATFVKFRKNCEPGDVTCRPRQRQALLHWAYDSRKI